MAFLTSRTLATGVTNNDLFHIVKPYDTSQNPDGSSYKATISQVFDSMSGYCIPLVFTSRISSCGKLEINSLDEGNIYLGSTSAVTIDLGVSSVGINRPLPQHSLDVNGDINVDYFNSNLTIFDNNTSAGSLRLSGTSGNLEEMIVFAPIDGSNNIGGISIGVRGFTASFPGYGSNGDTFLYGSFETNGLNIIKARSGSFPNNPNYIRFYAGENATNPSHMHIQGSGTTRGFIGMSTETPSSKLHVVGSVTIEDGTEQNDYVFTSDNNGLGSWKSKPYFINYFEFDSGAVTNVVSSGTWYLLNTTGTTSLFSRGELVHTNNRITYTGTTSRIFQVEGIISVSAGNNNQIHAAFFRNNSLYPCSEQVALMGSGGNSNSLPFHCIIQLNNGDYLEVFVKNQNSTTNITLSNVNVIIKEL